MFTAPGTIGSTSVRVTDAAGQTATAPITVVTSLQIAPAIQTLLIGGNKTFSATGGTPPYAYSVFSGGGSFTPGTGIFAAPGAPASVTVRVTDNLGATSNAVVTVMPQALVELLFEENANNWTSNSGTSNGTHTRAALNPRAFPVFSLGHPTGTSSLASVDFGDGTGWGADSDGVIDLVSQGGLRADFYDNNTLTSPLAIQRIESPVLSWLNGFYNASSSNTYRSGRYSGYVLSPSADTYAFDFFEGSNWTSNNYIHLAIDRLAQVVNNNANGNATITQALGAVPANRMHSSAARSTATLAEVAAAAMRPAGPLRPAASTLPPPTSRVPTCMLLRLPWASVA